MIQEERVRPLNDADARRGAYVLYWMQGAMRVGFNHAFAYAADRADEAGTPLVVVFGLTPDYPEANARHYAFLLQGLADVRRRLAERGVRLVALRGEPHEAALRLAPDAARVVVDGAVLRAPREWRARFAAAAPCLVEEVETDVVVPVEAASNKEEFAAATLRPKIRRALPRFLAPLAERRPRRSSLGLDLPRDEVDLDDVAGTLDALGADRSVPPIDDLEGGETAAEERLEEFLARGLGRYAERRNDPSLEDATSGLSPYLHFGQISPLRAALAVRARRGAGAEAFFEQLVVRRELSFNFCRFNPRCDRWEGLPAWCRGVLGAHAADPRPALYSFDELERAATHDPAWNAAQRQMVRSGTMHNYMRMYWGKKILEWSRTPEEGFAAALALNDKWQLDGRDPNSFAGVAWCFGKHDRPWGERPVFGKVRSMTAAGLARKFDMAPYLERWGAR